MKYVALEEAFSIAGLGDPMQHKLLRAKPDYAEQWQRKLADFTEYRLPEMDAAGIDIQVLSLTVPGLQVDIDATTARDRARSANDFLAQVISAHPTRFRGFAALPLQDMDAAVRELDRCVSELGFCGALVNDHLQGNYLTSRSMTRCGQRWNPWEFRCICTLGRRPLIVGVCWTVTLSSMARRGAGAPKWQGMRCGSSSAECSTGIPLPH